MSPVFAEHGLPARLDRHDAEVDRTAWHLLAIVDARAERVAQAGGATRSAMFLGLFVALEVIVLEVWALHTRYGLRVIADTPTYLQVMRGFGLRPLHGPESPYVSVHDVNVPHAAPDMQVLGLIWGWLGRHGFVNANLVDLDPAYQLLAAKGMLVTLLLFHALFLWASRQSGSSRTAWLTLAVLPAVWGPALIVSPGDLSFHGFMTTSDHSESLAIALMLYALIVLDGRLSARRLALGSVTVAAVMSTHPFTGIRFAALATALASYHALRGDRKWMVTPPALAIGFLVAGLWPAYDIAQAMQVSGLGGRQIVTALVAAPLLAAGAGATYRRGRSSVRLPRVPLDGPRISVILALAGLAGVCLVAVRVLWLYKHPEPFLPTNRRSIYWNGISIPYWPLLLAPAAVGLSGLARLGRRGNMLPLIWGVGCFSIGVAGALGAPIPLWHRFLLFAQITFALGVAVVLAGAGPRIARRLATATLVASATFALCVLVLMPPTVTYFRNQLQGGWALADFLPTADPSVVVASDPASEYFVLPLGDRVLTMTTWHISDKS